MAQPQDPRRPPAGARKSETEPTIKAASTPSPGGSSRTGATLIVPPEVVDAPATARFGKFVRTQKLGAGGMGEVWKAWDGDLGRWVALKFLKGGDEEEFARFDREAQLAAKLSHPNIAAIYEIGQAQGRRYIAMQFVEGATLKQFKTDDPKLIVRLLRDAAGAVGYANDLGIVHRDIKPENIMIALRGRGRSDSSTKVAEAHAYVMDFGLARAVEGGSEISISGSVVGTPAYMPPEQARGDRVEAGADVYSLGATLYALLTGRVPFRGKNVYDTLRMVQEEDVTPPRAIRPRLDADLETIILKCLEKERSRRYADAHELAADLTKYLDGDVISARKASLGYRLRRRAAKSKAALVVAGIGLAVTALAVAILLPIIFRERQGKTETEDALRLWSRIANLLTEAELNGRAGQRDASRRKLDEGIEICRGFLKTQDLADAHYFLGRLLAERSLDDEAEAAFSRALERNPALGEAAIARGLLRFKRYHARFYEILRGENLLVSNRILSDETFDLVEKEMPELADLRRGYTEDLARSSGQSSYFREVDALYARALGLWCEGKSLESDRMVRRILALDPLHVPTRVLLAGQSKDPVTAERLASELIRDHRGCEQAYSLRLHARFTLWKRSIEEGRRQALAAQIREDLEVLCGLLERRRDALAIRAQIREGLGEFEEARADLVEALREAPDDVELLLSMGTLQWKAREIEEARRTFELAAKGAPSRLQVRNNLALVRGELGEVPWALAEFDEILRARPSFRAALGNRAALRHRSGDTAGAVRDYEAILKHQPKDAEALASMGGLKLEGGDGAAAEEYVARALEVDPYCAMALHNRALLRQAQGRLADARRDFDRAVELDPRDGHAWFSRGTLRQEGGDAAGALEDYEQAIRFSPRDARPWFNRGILHDDAGRVDEAHRDFSEAIARDPRHFKARYYRGGVSAKQGRLAEALQDFDAAHDLDPRNTELLINRGILKRKKGEYDAALQDYNRALEVDPDLPDAYSCRGDLWDLRGENEQALKDYRKALEIAPADWPHRARIENNIKIIQEE